jgi:hypothetical protein
MPSVQASAFFSLAENTSRYQSQLFPCHESSYSRGASTPPCAQAYVPPSSALYNEPISSCWHEARKSEVTIQCASEPAKNYLLLDASIRQHQQNKYATKNVAYFSCR